MKAWSTGFLSLCLLGAATPAVHAAYITVVAGSTLTNNSGAPSFTPTDTDSIVGSDLVIAALQAQRNVTLNAGSGRITIAAPLHGQTTVDSVLTLTAGSQIEIDAAIDGMNLSHLAPLTSINATIGPLLSFTVDGTSTRLNAGIQGSRGSIRFSSDVDLGANVALRSDSGGFFSGRLDGPFDLTVTGNSSFAGAVGATRRLGTFTSLFGTSSISASFSANRASFGGPVFTSGGSINTLLSMSVAGGVNFVVETPQCLIAGTSVVAQVNVGSLTIGATTATITGTVGGSGGSAAAAATVLLPSAGTVTVNGVLLRASGVAISTQPTSNVILSNGVYSATASPANLNAADLAAALASSPIRVRASVLPGASITSTGGATIQLRADADADGTGTIA